MHEDVPHHRPVSMRLRGAAKAMRREPTEAEAKLWRLLRDRRHGVKFRRQAPFGRYILDFVCFEARLVVEADGGQHSGSSSDAERDRWLAAQGFRVARYWNNDILQNPEGVLTDLTERLFPSPLAGEGGREAIG